MTDAKMDALASRLELKIEAAASKTDVKIVESRAALEKQIGDLKTDIVSRLTPIERMNQIIVGAVLVTGLLGLVKFFFSNG